MIYVIFMNQEIEVKNTFFKLKEIHLIINCFKF